jgi:hypothetical protein
MFLLTTVLRPLGKRILEARTQKISGENWNFQEERDALPPQQSTRKENGLNA